MPTRTERPIINCPKCVKDNLAPPPPPTLPAIDQQCWTHFLLSEQGKNFLKNFPLPQTLLSPPPASKK